MYNSDCNKCNPKEEVRVERKEEGNCVTINIFCDDKKKEFKNREDDCRKENERKEEKSCVIVNIFCNDCNKESNGKEDDCGCREEKKENNRKEDKSCAVINIFCDDCKKDSKY
jgi:hypothetical protein